MMRKYIIFLFTFILIAGSGTKVSGENLQEVQPKGEEVVTGWDLFKSFDDNAIAAMMQYKDTGATICGDILDIVMLEDDKLIVIYLRPSRFSGKLFVVLPFNKNQSNIDRISKLKKGQEITVHGYPYDKFYKDDALAVVVKDCTIVDGTTQQK